MALSFSEEEASVVVSARTCPEIEEVFDSRHKK